MNIEEYFLTDFISDKAEITEIIATINSVLPTFFYSISSDEDFGWVYEITSNPPELPKNTRYSASTSSMVLYVLDKALNLTSKKNKDSSGLLQNLDIPENCNDVLHKQIELLVKASSSFKSPTFGNDDIFTLGWSRGVLKNYHLQRIEADYSGSSKKYKDSIASINTRTSNKIHKYFSSFKMEDLFDFDTEKSQTAVDHTFPILRAMQAYYHLQNDKQYDGKEINIEAVKAFLLTKIYTQLSLSEIINSNFDVSELVFALEALLLIDKNDSKSINFDLINRIFEVVKVNQNKSPYWRPLKPFIVTSQGMGLLPLSVEIANSLLRICTTLENYKAYYFDIYVDLFRNYTLWLKSRLVTITGKNNQKYHGWQSEHINKQGLIHPWETAQVIHFLVFYEGLLQKHIARRCLDLSKLQNKLYSFDKEFNKSKTNYWNFVKDKYDPVQLLSGNKNESLQIFESIDKNFILPRTNESETRSFSMLLYGPPGTGKTTIAEQIAATLKWPLIIITPSDFLISGGDAVELRAKMIFNTLVEQENVVILFDEIDRLVLDRDSELYEKQGDVFQFMTPSMLVKIRDLRKSENSIFIIGTNYDDRIDLAIKRIGRIDHKYLVLSKNVNARVRTISDVINGVYKNNFIDKDSIVSLLRKIVIDTCFMTHEEMYKELKSKIKKIEKNLNVDNFCKALNDVNLELPSIRLQSYISRFKSSADAVLKSNQEPFKEFLLLLHLRIELDLTLDENEKFTKENKKILSRVFLRLIDHKNEISTDYFSGEFMENLRVHLVSDEFDDVRQKLNIFFKTNHSVLN